MKYTRSMLRGYDKKEGQYIAKTLHIEPSKKKDTINHRFKVKKLKRGVRG